MTKFRIEWASNWYELIEDYIPSGSENEHVIKDKGDNRTLRIIWKTDDDLFKFSFEGKDDNKPPTKREISKVLDL